MLGVKSTSQQYFRGEPGNFTDSCAARSDPFSPHYFFAPPPLVPDDQNTAATPLILSVTGMVKRWSAEGMRRLGTFDHHPERDAGKCQKWDDEEQTVYDVAQVTPFVRQRRLRLSLRLLTSYLHPHMYNKRFSKVFFYPRHVFNVF